MRSCELCGAEPAPNDPVLKCSCGGTILPPPDEPKGVICMVCMDTGQVGITVQGGIEIRSCPRGCPPLNLKLKIAS